MLPIILEVGKEMNLEIVKRTAYQSLVSTTLDLHLSLDPLHFFLALFW